MTMVLKIVLKMVLKIVLKIVLKLPLAKFRLRRQLPMGLLD